MKSRFSRSLAAGLQCNAIWVGRWLKKASMASLVLRVLALPDQLV